MMNHTAEVAKKIWMKRSPMSASHLARAGDGHVAVVGNPGVNETMTREVE